MNIDYSKPIAWAFYNTDGKIRFILEDEQRMLAWKGSHQGNIVPLYASKENSQDINKKSQT